jgi:hypothetical protein
VLLDLLLGLPLSHVCFPPSEVPDEQLELFLRVILGGL